MKKFWFFCALLSTLVSCKQASFENQRIKQENDSLKLHILKNEVEMNELFTTLNVIEESIQAIRLNEDVLLIQKDSELSESRREQLNKHIKLLNETLKNNKELLADLQDKLNESSISSSALQKTIDRLMKEVDEKGVLIVALQNELEKKDVHIETMSSQIEELFADVTALESVKKLQTDLIVEQEEELNTVYYCFGTKKELKEQNIVTGSGLFSKTMALQGNFKHDYFLAIDKRTVTSIPLYSSKATLISNHPNGSWRFVKDRDGKLTLEIQQIAAFWSLSRYLVIEVR